MENLTKTEIDYSMAQARVNQLKKFYVSLLLFRHGLRYVQWIKELIYKGHTYVEFKSVINC